MEIKPQLLTGRPHLTREGKCQTGIRLAEANRFVFAWKSSCPAKTLWLYGTKSPKSGGSKLSLFQNRPRKTDWSAKNVSQERCVWELFHGEGSRIMIDSSNESEIGFQLFESLNAHNSPIQIRSLKYQQIVNRFNAVLFSCHNFRFTNRLSDL